MTVCMEIWIFMHKRDIKGKVLCVRVFVGLEPFFALGITTILDKFAPHEFCQMPVFCAKTRTKWRIHYIARQKVTLQRLENTLFPSLCRNPWSHLKDTSKPLLQISGSQISMVLIMGFIYFL